MTKADAFWLGVMGMGGFEGLMQDVRGQDGMIELVQHHWVSGWISGPFEVAMVLVAALGLFSIKISQ
jgi:hypothetical protein